MRYFFTGDEHHYHKNIIQYCDRPFKNTIESAEIIIDNHNKVVKPDDNVIHLGDFTLLTNKEEVHRIISKLNGNHIFLRGSHDRWMDRSYHEIWEETINGQHIVACHYAMRVWPRSHYGSWQVYAHSHGGLPPIGKQWDVGVDNNNFYPLSFDEIVEIMKTRPDNFNLVRKDDK
jgi:calcineurin-like phosphoesterase family protein